MKKVLFFLTITASLFIIKDLVYSIYTLWSKKDLLVVAQKELVKEQKEHAQFASQLTMVKKQEFIESEARNKLFLVKPGEQVVVLPQAQKSPKKVIVVRKQANWEAWLNLFF